MTRIEAETLSLSLFKRRWAHILL